MYFLALSLFLWGSVFANEGMAANTITSNEIYCSDDTKARDTTVTTDLESYKNVIVQMKEIGWYLKEMSIDTKNNIVKITFTDLPPHIQVIVRVSEILANASSTTRNSFDTTRGSNNRHCNYHKGGGRPKSSSPPSVLASDCSR